MRLDEATTEKTAHMAVRQIFDDAATVVAALARAVEAKDVYTRGHSDRVTVYAQTLASAAGLPCAVQRLLAHAGPLHDVGKIGVPDAVLCKHGPLSDDELALMKRHPEIGDEICRPLRSLRSVRPAIRHHHERYDGHGYPDGLAGRDIPVAARVLAIADAYDAMTSERSYRMRMTSRDALAVLMENRGPRWDPYLVSVFCSHIERSHHAFGSGIPHLARRPDTCVERRRLDVSEREER